LLKEFKFSGHQGENSGVQTLHKVVQADLTLFHKLIVVRIDKTKV